MIQTIENNYLSLTFNGEINNMVEIENKIIGEIILKPLRTRFYFLYGTQKRG